MYRMSTFSPAEIQGELKLKRNPFHSGLGHYTDTSGIVWDVSAVLGCTNPPTVCARQVRQHPNYYGTHTWASSNGSHTWLSYTVKIMKGEAKG